MFKNNCLSFSLNLSQSTKTQLMHKLIKLHAYPLDRILCWSLSRFISDAVAWTALPWDELMLAVRLSSAATLYSEHCSRISCSTTTFPLPTSKFVRPIVWTDVGRVRVSSADVATARVAGFLLLAKAFDAKRQPAFIEPVVLDADGESTSVIFFLDFSVPNGMMLVKDVGFVIAVLGFVSTLLLFVDISRC